MTNRAPLIVAIVLLVIPVLYVGSYLALVSPNYASHGVVMEMLHGRRYFHGYRNGGDWAWRLFWPLEQIDRMARPEEWPAAPICNGR